MKKTITHKTHVEAGPAPNSSLSLGTEKLKFNTLAQAHMRNANKDEARMSANLLEVHSIAELASKRPLPDIVVGDLFSPGDVLDLYLSDGVRHIVQRSNLDVQAEMRLSQLMLNEPETFLKDPLSSILEYKREGLSSELAIQIGSVSEKNSIIEQIGVHLETITQSKNLVYDISVVADELITNAIFNAPYVDPDNIHSGPARNSEAVEVDPNKKPEFFCGKNDGRIVVGVRDSYGSLNAERLIKRIQLCYKTNPKDQMSFTEGGARIGAFMIFESCSALYIGIKKNSTTVVCCAFPTRISSRHRTLMPKNLHVFSK